MITTDVTGRHLTEMETQQTSEATSSLSSLPDLTSSISSEPFSAITTAPFEISSLPASSSSSPTFDSTTLTTTELSSALPETSTLNEQTTAPTTVTEYLTFSASVSSLRSRPMRTRRSSRRPRTTTITSTRTYRTRRRTSLSTLPDQSTSAVDLLQSFLHSTSLNLTDLPPSSWNLSLQTNRSLLLDITLPSSNVTSNLTLADIQADRFVASIVGSSVNLQVHEVEAKEFSLTMNLTSVQPSEVIIGHVRSEHFQLTLSKTDEINLQVQRVDADTAELIFDDQFCSRGSDVEINLNLSKNGNRSSHSSLVSIFDCCSLGTIRFGNRPPLSFGSVFARVRMLKQSCDTEQPFVLFFDLCERENPCLNGGTCQSTPPNYNDPASPPAEISYHCLCPPDASGEHCQYLRYPFGYCVNDGSLVEAVDHNKRPIKVCACPAGFRGEHCEENINDCAGILCSKRGICQDAINNYTCICFDGFYGEHCQETETETMLLQVVSKSFAVVAMLLIASIAALVVASDIHTYVTRRKPHQQRSLLLGSDEIAIEMDHFSPNVTKRRKKCLPNHSSTGYAQLFQSQSVNSLPTHYTSASLSFA